jgi:hypothetical protein
VLLQAPETRTDSTSKRRPTTPILQIGSIAMERQKLEGIVGREIVAVWNCMTRFEFYTQFSFPQFSDAFRLRERLSPVVGSFEFEIDEIEAISHYPEKQKRRITIKHRMASSRPSMRRKQHKNFPRKVAIDSFAMIAYRLLVLTLKMFQGINNNKKICYEQSEFGSVTGTTELAMLVHRSEYPKEGGGCIEELKAFHDRLRPSE